MSKYVLYLSALIVLISCKSTTSIVAKEVKSSDFTIAFGSCNKHDLPNLLWDDIEAAKPDIWVWGGDNVYADTDNMLKLRSIYSKQDEIAGYKSLKTKVPVIGTWDDHDYGSNDGGVEFPAKADSQQELLDFLDVPEDSPRRKQEGVYTVHDYNSLKGKVKVIVLDTRYFRTALTLDTETKKRTKPNTYGEGTILGEAQWNWLNTVLSNSEADFNIIISSIQFLSNEHGFECWGNFPHEVDRFKELLVDSKAKGVIILSGDRHISEFSKTAIDGLDYPLIDFTSSGLTHAYTKFSGESNPFRVDEVVNAVSFGVLKFDFKTNMVVFKMIGDNGVELGSLEQSYE